MRNAVYFSLAVLILTHCSPRNSDGKKEAVDDPNIFQLSQGDQLVLKAMRSAQDSLVFLVNFWDIYGGEDDYRFFLKRTFHDGADEEHMWSRLVKVYDGGFLAVLDNEPGVINNLRMGDTVRVKFKDVEDFMIVMPDSTVVGNYLRALMMEDSIP